MTSPELEAAVAPYVPGRGQRRHVRVFNVDQVGSMNVYEIAAALETWLNGLPGTMVTGYECAWNARFFFAIISEETL